MATNQHRSAAFLGVLNIANQPANTFALNGALSAGFSVNWLTIGLNPSESKTLSAIKVFCSAVAGTLGATNLVCDIYSDTAGTGPNASLASSSTVTATPTGAAWVEFTGFNLALTAGTQYWIVLRNANGTPTVNAPTYRYGSNNSFVGAGQSESSAAKWGTGGVLTSTNSGGTWASSTASYGWGYRVQYSDGTYDGVPISSFGVLTNANSTFGKQAIGVQLVTPPGATLNIRGAQMGFQKTSTPGACVFKLYNGSILLDTSASIPAGNVTSVRMFAAMFPSTLVVQPGTTLNLVLCDLTTGDALGTSYNQQAYTVDNDANSFSLMPFEGTLRKVVTTDYTVGSPVFATDQTTVIPFSLILDSTGEFTSSGGVILVEDD